MYSMCCRYMDVVPINAGKLAALHHVSGRACLQAWLPTHLAWAPTHDCHRTGLSSTTRTAQRGWVALVSQL